MSARIPNAEVTILLIGREQQITGVIVAHHATSLPASIIVGWLPLGFVLVATIVGKLNNDFLLVVDALGYFDVAD